MSSARRVIPLLDIADWRASPKRFATQLREACHRVGFFTLRHRLPDGMARAHWKCRVLCVGHREEAQMDYRNSPAFRGYMPLGVESTGGLTDLREQVELAAEPAGLTRAPRRLWAQPVARRSDARAPSTDRGACFAHVQPL